MEYENEKLIIRNAITIYDDDNAISFLKPLSSSYDKYLFVIYEDAYGDAINTLMHVESIKKEYHLTDGTINNIIKKLK